MAKPDLSFTALLDEANKFMEIENNYDEPSFYLLPTKLE